MANDSLSTRASPDGWLAASSSGLSLEPGLLLAGRYCLLRPAGFGGMGAVWVARNESTGAEVAVKILVTAHKGVDHEVILRFRREANAAAQLYHRGIVRVFDLIELSLPATEDADSAVLRAGSTGAGGAQAAAQVPDALVMVMELLRGETLASHMDRKRRFSLEETLAIVLPILSGLAHAHAQGIVHRDLKPENVFLAVDPDGHVIPKILDFGISKLLEPAAPKITTDGAMLGTPNYMSPEQARGLPDVDARADVFAAGILLYECLAGENPFSSGSYHSVVAAILERDPEPLTSIPAEVWCVIKRALEKTPAARYVDAGALGTALREAAQTAGARTPESSGAYPARGSLGDGSVPPAPFREPEATLPSIYVEARKRARLRWTVGGAIGLAALVAVAGLYARSSRAPSFDAPASATSEPRAAVPPAPPPLAAAASAEATTGATVTITPSIPEPEPAASAGGRARAPGRPLAPRAKPAPSAAPPAPPSPPPKSAVVRDPGF